MCARTRCPFCSSTRNIALGSGSTTRPSISMAPSFFGMSSVVLREIVMGWIANDPAVAVQGAYDTRLAGSQATTLRHVGRVDQWAAGGGAHRLRFAICLPTSTAPHGPGTQRNQTCCSEPLPSNTQAQTTKQTRLTDR